MSTIPTETPSYMATISTRLPTIDLLRGLVMVLMALDHVRDFFSNAQFDPLSLAQTTPALFLTRWITHFCAPTFALLAGMSAYLYGAHGHTRSQVSRFLLTRGLLLLVLEFTLVHLGWFFSIQTDFLLAQVIWMLGWCMIALAVLIFLPRWLLLFIAIVMTAGHNLLDTASAASLGLPTWLWIVLHQGGSIPITRNLDLFVRYPLIPWIGVMAFGYALAPMLQRPPTIRRRWLLLIGLAVTIAFVIIRLLNTYGDPSRWVARPTPILTVLSFLNTEKYPPSLLFLLMTLGPAFILLSLLDRVRDTNHIARFFITFGRVPLFYYVAHLALAHTLAVIFSLVRYGDASWLIGSAWLARIGLPSNYGYELTIVYGVWLCVVMILYPICHWYAQQKRRYDWLRYF